MRWPTTRAMMSLGPPGGNGTISLIGLFGKFCAAADSGTSTNVKPVASAPSSLMPSSRPEFLNRSRIWQLAALFGTVPQCRLSLKWPKRFRAEHALGPDPGVGTDSRQENASN
jgi:hypothetical protein